MTSRSRPENYTSAFGRALDEQLAKRGMRQKELAAALGRSPARVNRTMTGDLPPSSRWVELVADVLQASAKDRTTLHRAAARDNGFKIERK